jgi:hypothetical protein
MPGGGGQSQCGGGVCMNNTNESAQSRLSLQATAGSSGIGNGNSLCAHSTNLPIPTPGSCMPEGGYVPQSGDFGTGPSPACIAIPI